MTIDSVAQQEVVQRLGQSARERKQTLRYLKDGEVWKADDPKRVEMRKVRLLADQSLTPILGQENHDALARDTVQNAPEEAQRAFERQIGGKDTQPCWFLTRGAELRRAVGRIQIRDANRRIGWGTGFLVAPALLLTNQHVLDSLETARHSRVEFDFEETFSGDILLSATFDLLPDLFFVSNPAVAGLDYALVAVAPQARADSRRPDATLAEFGYNALIREEGKLVKGELINSIHHPEGQPRQVSLRENRLTALLEHWMHYETDTEPGSSGAPLYNNQWEVVGIHHSGVEKRDSNGNILALGGGIWTPEMGERQKWWDANEGLRVSRFIKNVEQQVADAIDAGGVTVPERIVTEQGRALFEMMLNPSSRPSTPDLHPFASPIAPEVLPPTPTSTPRRFRPE